MGEGAYRIRNPQKVLMDILIDVVRNSILINRYLMICMQASSCAIQGLNL